MNFIDWIGRTDGDDDDDDQDYDDDDDDDEYDNENDNEDELSSSNEHLRMPPPNFARTNQRPAMGHLLIPTYVPPGQREK